MRYDFGSDNTAGMALSAIEGLVRANKGFARAYGADDITARAADQPGVRITISAALTAFVFAAAIGVIDATRVRGVLSCAGSVPTAADGSAGVSSGTLPGAVADRCWRVATHAGIASDRVSTM